MRCGECARSNGARLPGLRFSGSGLRQQFQFQFGCYIYQSGCLVRVVVGSGCLLGGRQAGRRAGRVGVKILPSPHPSLS